MKLECTRVIRSMAQSLPLPGAWIEITTLKMQWVDLVSLPLPGVQIEINRMTNGTQIFYTTDEESNRYLLCAFCHTLSAQFGT